MCQGIAEAIDIEKQHTSTAVVRALQRIAQSVFDLRRYDDCTERESRWSTRTRLSDQKLFQFLVTRFASYRIETEHAGGLVSIGNCAS